MKQIFGFMLAAATLAPVASAQISDTAITTYNDAVQSGDTSQMVAAAKALAAEAAANPTEADATAIAFDAASLICAFGDCADAAAAAEFVANAPVIDAQSHPVAAERALLSSFAKWSAKPSSRARRAFDDALDVIAPMAPSQLSIKAMEARYTHDLDQGRTRTASKSAGQAGDHLRPIANDAPLAYASAEYLAAIALFNARQSKAALEDIIHLQGWLLQYEASLGEDAPDWTRKHYYNARAWGYSMNAWFASSDRTSLGDRKIEAILASYDTGEDEDDVSEDGLPFCEGAFNASPKLRYSTRQAARNEYGAVILTSAIEDGKVVDPVVQAAIPAGVFEDNILETIGQWVWEPSDDQTVGVDCSMSIDETQHSYVFVIN